MKKFNSQQKNNTARSILFLAAVYNLVWGAWVVIYPESIVFTTQDSDAFLMVFSQCLGMLVGVYGIAYWIASQDPLRYWPLVLVGLIGKIFGPLGAAVAVFKGDLPLEFLVVNLGNDIIWLAPFAWIVFEVFNAGFTKNEKSDLSLYERWLGSDFTSLAPNLHDFHQAKEAIRVKGFFKVLRGKSVLTHWLGEVSKLPAASEKEEVELLVEQKNEMEFWHRRIGSHSMLSEQKISNGHLVEKFGLIRIHLNAEVRSGELYIYDQAASFCGLPFPPFFTPWVKAHGKDSGEGVFIKVEVGLYPFGRIIQYEGLVAVTS